MVNLRAITRLHEDKAKRVIHVFSETGYEFTAPLGFRSRDLKVGRRLDDEAFDALREDARAFERGRADRRTARRERLADTRATAGRITGLKHESRHARVYVELDGSYAFTVSVDQLVDAGLYVGRELNEANVASLREGYGVVRVLGMIDRLTSYRPRTAAEIRKRLSQKGIAEAVIETALPLRSGESGGVLSDAAFARWFAEHRGVPRGKGFRRIVPELRRLGVGDEGIAAAETDYATEDARTIALARAARGLDLTNPKLRQRFVARVQRAGFGYGEARDYLEALQTSGDDDLDEAAATEN